MKILERIENAHAESLMKGENPKKLLLGKTEFAQLKKEMAAQARVKIEGKQVGESRIGFMRDASFLTIEPTETPSEFRIIVA